MSKNNKLAKAAYIEQQIVGLANKEGALIKAARFFEKKYQLPNGLLGNGLFYQPRVISLLYMLIVLPKEYWKLDSSHEIYRNIESLWNISCVQISIDDLNKPDWTSIYKFIHCLRNAVSHANFEFHDEYFEFWNKPKPTSDTITYKAKIFRGDLDEFLEVIGSYFANHEN